MMKKCKYEECKRKHCARGLCKLHYYKEWYRPNNLERTRELERARNSLNREALNKKARVRYAKDPRIGQRSKERARASREKNRDRINRLARERYAKNPDQFRRSQRERRLNHPDKFRIYNRTRYTKNGTRINQLQRERRLKDPDRTRQYLRDLYAKKPEYFIHHSFLRRVALHKSDSGLVSPTLLREIINSERCNYCKCVPTKYRSVEHKIPLCRQSEYDWKLHHPDNLVMSCKSCNSKKSMRTEDEFFFKMKHGHESPSYIAFLDRRLSLKPK